MNKLKERIISKRNVALGGLLVLLVFACEKAPVEDNGILVAKAPVVYPKYRVWTSPSGGEEVKFNPPSLQWPSVNKKMYNVRLSSSKNFSENIIEKEGIPFAIFNPHKQLDEGMWYWQYKANNESWGKVDSFRINSSTRVFDTPVLGDIIKNISTAHPRVLAKKDQLQTLRLRAKDYVESSKIIEMANHYVDKPAPKEQSAMPTYKGKNKFEDSKIASLASKNTGWNVFNVLNSLSQAYILTGEEKYFETSKKWMMEISTWDPKGPTHTNNFGDSGIMTGLAIALDTYWDKLSAEERELLIKQISARANSFYSLWVGKVESRSSSMHVWQHIMHWLLQTTLALTGETPDADLWLEYIYELWIAQCPKMGETDGAWFNGTGYFRMNTLTMYDISDIFTELSGVNFMNSEWYPNNPKWMLYAFPPNSVADGFCNDGDKYEKPNVNYAGYADVAARRFKDPYASLYAKECLDGLGMDISNDNEWAWYRVIKGYKEQLPEIDQHFKVSQAAIFQDVGVAYMHTTLPEIENNLMLSMRSSPFGSMGHTHAEQNGFNIAFGGKRLFYNTGYRPSMGDPHMMGWYKHTQGHNSVLIDGKGQPFNAGAYGWMPRFLHGQQISYAIGDASNAYSGSDMGESVDLGVRTFRRHYIMLRPSIIIIYDELEADHNAEWSWLLHNDTGLKINAEMKTITGKNESAGAQVSLYSSSPIEYKVSDQFSVPVENWTKKRDKNGDLIVFKNQWHFIGISKEKTEKMRYLAIIQVKPDNTFEQVEIHGESEHFVLGDWIIKASLDVNQPAYIEVIKNDGSAGLVSSGQLNLGEKIYKGEVTGSSKLAEKIGGELVFKEVVDELPPAVLQAERRLKGRLKREIE